MHAHCRGGSHLADFVTHDIHANKIRAAPQHQSRDRGATRRSTSDGKERSGGAHSNQIDGRSIYARLIERENAPTQPASACRSAERCAVCSHCRGRMLSAAAVLSGVTVGTVCRQTHPMGSRGKTRDARWDIIVGGAQSSRNVTESEDLVRNKPTPPLGAGEMSRDVRAATCMVFL